MKHALFIALLAFAAALPFLFTKQIRPHEYIEVPPHLVNNKSGMGSRSGF